MGGGASARPAATVATADEDEAKLDGAAGLPGVRTVWCPNDAVPSSLASRHKFQPLFGSHLQVVACHPFVSLLSRLGSPGLGLGRRAGRHTEPPKPRIRWEDHFAARYCLGPEVMPSVHPEMLIRFATRLSDGERVVVKLRGKAGSFPRPEEEREWRGNMEFMLNLPRVEGIAQLYEVVEDAKWYYVVMEKVEGMDLCEMLDRTGKLPLATCREVLLQLLAALADLHGWGLIHKDIKLENVMVDATPKFFATPGGSVVSTRTPSEAGTSPSPHVKIIDFDTVEEWSPQTAHARRCVVGTDQYIAQEAYGGKYSPASDIFAVGVIAYRMLTGRFPFKPHMFDDEAGENWIGSPKMKMIQTRLQAFSINYNLPPFIAEPQARRFCEALLEVNEELRPSTVEALAHPFLAPAGAPPAGAGA